jgi:ribA/ribD-fused uncharacterized protein
MSEEKKVILFYRASEEHGYMSNFAMYSIDIDEITFCCNEQYIMFRKAKLFKDAESMTAIMDATSPSVIKALGRKVKGFKQESWDIVIKQVADNCNLHKFLTHTKIRDALLDTGDAILAEASSNDAIWGIGVSKEDGLDPKKWKGTNILGESLMRVRKIILNYSKATGQICK